MKKGTWKDYFSFSKKERIAVVILLIIIAVFIALPYFFSPSFKKPAEDVKLEQQLNAMQPKNTAKKFYADSNNYNAATPFVSADETENIKAELFYFDPNTLDADGWKRLGVKDKTVQTILNYLHKGGQFRKPEDIRKIYGLRKEQADAFIPYIQIRLSATQTNKTQPRESIPSNNNNSYPASKPKKQIDINTATVEEWKSLPGIGDVLSNRIVKFRNAIHGFKSVDDLKRTYGLKDSTFQIILPYLKMTDSTDQKE